MNEALPTMPGAARTLASGLITETFSGVAKRFSEALRTEAEIVAFADALGDMLCAYLETLGRM